MMMKMSVRLIVSLLVLLSSVGGVAQSLPGFKIEKIEKQVKDFPLDSINLTSPLDYYLSRAQVMLSGKFKDWGKISTSMFDYSADVPDEEVDDIFRNYVTDEIIDYVATYRDSVACIVTHHDGENLLFLNNCWLEDGRWVNRGQELAMSPEEAENKLAKQLPEALYNLPRVAIINKMPEDAAPFAEYLSSVTASPEEFLLEMLGSHKVVINGEYHRRKVSWDMLKRLIAMPGFPETVGRIFMELPSWHQPTMDSFMRSEVLDGNLILQIFQDEQPNGWWDRGEYEFLCELWKLNRSLPMDKRIKVILADYQVHYSRITEKEEAKLMKDRNTHMAEVVVSNVLNAPDERHSLFLVGCAHVYESNQAGIASKADGKKADLTAGAQITEALGEENVFTVFQHALPGDNSGGNKKPARGGIFDEAFRLNGDKPVGFGLAGSPFGTEPFDGIYEIKYKTATGTYQDNFDGYLFLAPLDSEPQAAPLIEIFTDEFVEEMKRRAAVLGYENLRYLWFGLPASRLTRDYILKAFEEN